MLNPIKIISWTAVPDRQPVHTEIKNLDLVIVRYDDEVSVLYGRCLHRGALMSDGHIEGDDLICGLHGWDYRYDTGVSAYNDTELLHKFNSKIEDGFVWIDEQEIDEFGRVEFRPPLEVQVDEDRTVAVAHVFPPVLPVIDEIEQRGFSDAPLADDGNGLGMGRIQTGVHLPDLLLATEEVGGILDHDPVEIGIACAIVTGSFHVP